MTNITYNMQPIREFIYKIFMVNVQNIGRPAPSVSVCLATDNVLGATPNARKVSWVPIPST